jgi:PPK2 family polyphosphate:nucleotide phosphotransferase
MKLGPEVVDELVVRPGHRARLAERSTDETLATWLGPLGKTRLHEVAEHDLEGFRRELSHAQERLYASGTHAVLIVLQGIDAAGKDGTVKHVMAGMNPQGCRVTAFKEPSAEELNHDFLWRCARQLPERGCIGVFNRSYYEEVLVVRVHPELLERQRLPHEAGTGDDLWRARYEDIVTFERHLHRNGTHVVKVFLHLSKAEQKRRFLERLDDPSKQWKFSAADLAERAFWDDYQAAHETALSATSTAWAPWYVVPADHKDAARALVGGILVHVIDGLDLEAPAVDPDERASLDAARAALVAEGGAGS